ncbi:helix-turn-helix transcriptional regulator [Nocardiopsis suaedae]|uniref:YafY family protein n=1 Tax=Nocardiopsis suaedae TaxID=3018444 RepID=A0ABT4TRG3_9ACTN|nr:YafY family protein [Nocardiopsis suaedae]MDA2806727.1 YafY family protein [Nocardiopsis suaedae]
MKSDRLLSILLLLQTRSRVRAAELAERLEVSVRTVYRDVEALSAAGVPVYAERGRRGGIALLPGFRTDVSGLTAPEAQALFVLASGGAHSALGLDGALGSALRKVMAALPAPHRPAAEQMSRRIIVEAERWYSGPRADADLRVLKGALFGDRRLRLGYRHGDGREAEYTADPYALVAKAGVWYLVADAAGQPRLFRVDRVLWARELEEPVRRRLGQDPVAVWEELRGQVERRPEGVRVHVRVRASKAALFTRILGPFLAEPPEPESGAEWCGAVLAYPEVRAVRQLLQFGGDVRVSAPQSARDVMAEETAALAALYGLHGDGAGGEDVPEER